ncbi:D-sedoheptulose 7-phosphate isomerase [Candidatus Thioglobus sp.]|jgi:D-sedoheptulose 7-phosphate isomerase|nr:D-sedoheptulose 7-phosphate isomerase [Candidatus Thioglobus sp.]
MNSIINDEINEHIKVSNLLHKKTEEIINISQLCINSIQNDGKILLFGNGGSAADAQHIAAELVGRYKIERRGIPAIALTTDTSILTAIGNDYGYSHIFDRQVEALADSSDVVIGISTSGSSINVINGLKVASKLGCKTIGFSGQDGGEMKQICDINIAIPSLDTPRIQEMHILIGHIICNLIEIEFKV